MLVSPIIFSCPTLITMENVEESNNCSWGTVLQGRSFKLTAGGECPVTKLFL